MIQAQLKTGGNVLPWTDPEAFAQRKFEYEMRSWYVPDGNQPCFFDRGLPDIAGYLNLMALPVPEQLNNAITTFRYATMVFIAPPWKAIFVQDDERKQSFDEAVRTYHVMVDVYQQLGYVLVELPCMSIDERVSFVIDNVIA